MTKALQWTEINSKNFLSFFFFLGGGRWGQGGGTFYLGMLLSGRRFAFSKLIGFDSRKKLETLLKANSLKCT